MGNSMLIRESTIFIDIELFILQVEVEWHEKSFFKTFNWYIETIWNGNNNMMINKVKYSHILNNFRPLSSVVRIHVRR